MKIFKLSFPRSEIFEAVSCNSEYAAAKSQDTETSYDRMATVNDDESLLLRFWSEVCDSIISKFMQFVSASSVSDSSLEITLEVSSAFDDNLVPSIQSDLSGVLTAGVTERWFRYVYPERASEFATLSGTLLDRAFRKLCFRRRPLRGC